jgi:hypothetical protein
VYDASAYFNWKKTLKNFKCIPHIQHNAETRFQAIQSLIKQGDKRAIDSVGH